MGMLKKALAAVTAAVMGLQMTAFADITANDVYTDTNKALQRMVDYGVLKEDADGTVHGGELLTRAQMAQMFVKLLKAEDLQTDMTFNDVPADMEYAQDIAKAAAIGIMQGDKEGMIRPDEYITFQECYVMLVRALDFMPLDFEYGGGQVWVIGKPSDKCLDRFDDKDQISDWALDSVKAIVSNGGWKGIDNRLMPNEYVKQQDFAVMVDQLVGSFIDYPGIYANLPDTGAILVRSGGVVIEKLHTKYNVVMCYNIGSMGAEIQGSAIDGSVVVYGGADKIKDQYGNDKPGAAKLQLGGRFRDIRVREPYITVDCSNAKVSFFMVNKNSLLLLP